ncbi:MAG: GMC family oxidoreductase [Alcanivoracaceae bacterium]|nr:GMC family oxidoreductase [Alcanivoracaceae bacterium]
MNDLSKLEVRGIRDPWKEGLAAGWSVIDSSQLNEDQTIEADVVIIGSGAGGGVSAEILSQSGLRVVIIEAAKLKSTDQFNMDEGEAYRDLYQEGAARAAKDGSIAILQGRAVGGTTVVNWTSSFRTPEQTLSYWQNNFGVTGLSRSELDPWFEKMEKRLRVSKWAMPPNANNNALKNGCEALGWGWSVIPRNVDGCWNLGYCGTGCPTNAKQSMLVTTLPSAMESGATLVHSAEARTLEHDGTRVTAVLCNALDGRRQATGKTVRVVAKTFVAAGGGINTPALLMRAGVPDPHERLGKRTFLHPTTLVLGDFEERVDGYYGAPQSLYSDQFTWRDGVDGAIGYKMEVMPTHPGLMSSLIGGYGSLARTQVSRLPHYAAAIAMMRDGFHDESEGGAVELSKYGDAVLDYVLNDYVLEGLRHSHLKMAEMLFAAGAQSVRAGHGDMPFMASWKQVKELIPTLKYAPGMAGCGSAHVMGGCTMGADETRCLTDSEGRYHHLENLYVFDGSVLPTSLGVNPQLTIYGMTARNATRLATRLQA